MAPEVALGGYLLDRPHSGSAVYAEHLVRWLPIVAPEFRYSLFVHHPGVGTDDVAMPVHRIGAPVSGLESHGSAGRRAEKMWWETVSLPVAAARRGAGLVHSLYFAAPPVAGCPVVVTIHDIVPLVFPGYHRSRFSRWYSQFMEWSARRAQAIVTVSEHARGDIISVLGIPPERVHVTYEAASERFGPEPGADDAEVRARLGLPERYVLYIGGSERRKNVEHLVRLWGLMRAQMRDREVNLAIVANFPPPDPLYPDIPGLVRDLDLTQDILLIPRVDDHDQPALYRGALALAFPSIYEGFGFTPLEAMACGTPVVVSDRTSLPEVVGDGGIVLDPDDTEAWKTSLLRLADSVGERTLRREAGLRQAGRFSWKRTASQTARVYAEVLSQ